MRLTQVAAYPSLEAAHLGAELGAALPGGAPEALVAAEESDALVCVCGGGGVCVCVRSEMGRRGWGRG